MKIPKQIPWSHATSWHHQTKSFIFIILIVRPLVAEIAFLCVFQILCWQDSKISVSVRRAWPEEHRKTSTWLPLLLWAKVNTDALPLICKQPAVRVVFHKVSVSAPTHTQRHVGSIPTFTGTHIVHTHIVCSFHSPPSQLSHTLSVIISLCTETCRHLFGSVWLAGILCVGLFVPQEQRGFY